MRCIEANQSIDLPLLADPLWDVAGINRSIDELPISPALATRIAAWRAWHDEEDERASKEPNFGNGWYYREQDPGKPLAQFPTIGP